MSKTAIITGITGQDAAYLAQYLLQLDYRVIGTYRRTSSINFWRIEELKISDHPNLTLVEYDLTDTGDSFRLIQNHKPDEVYNLAAQSFVGVSFHQPYATAQITGIGALNLLEAIKYCNKDTRFYQASTSELYGEVKEIPQSEETPFHPRSPYGVAKQYAHWITRNFQESYGIFATSGILFNHESPIRGKEFVTRKITSAVGHILCGKQQCLNLGNLYAKRDWGYAKDYVIGMHQIMQAESPEIYVLATGRTESVKTFTEMSFSFAGVELEWEGEGIEEIARDKKSGEIRVKIDSELHRPAEVGLLVGDPSKVNRELGWKAETTLEQLCEMMVNSDIDKAKAGLRY